jgi:hypothetical protein
MLAVQPKNTDCGLSEDPMNKHKQFALKVLNLGLATLGRPIFANAWLVARFFLSTFIDLGAKPGNRCIY